ncbi:hypothetical protein [Pelagibius marinus]|uniref:hypothetical protein n=1 Tax=Pelagibius marinus TaxID=2762760 RepID=UPI001872E060|nr:hypothetical protein [Pelagibius marinus]
MVAQEIRDLGDEPIRENTPSELDELTHAEMCMLYKESADSIRFAKAHQWKSLGSTLLVFGGLIALAQLVPYNATITNLIIAISFLCSCAVIYMLALYQVWQNTEREKLRDIAGHFSSFSQFTRAIKSSREANVHRYTLLVFMIAALILGNVLLVLVVSPLYH